MFYDLNATSSVEFEQTNKNNSRFEMQFFNQIGPSQSTARQTAFPKLCHNRSSIFRILEDSFRISYPKRKFELKFQINKSIYWVLFETCGYKDFPDFVCIVYLDMFQYNFA